MANNGRMLRNNNNNNVVLGARVGVSPRRGGNNFNQGAWTPGEDAILCDYVRTYGERGWNYVHKNTTLLRTGKSCRLRWINHLRPNLKKGPMCPKEEAQIIGLQSKYGNKWSIIANHIEGRTDNDIKNYWNMRLKKCRRDGLPIYPPPEIQQPSFSVVKSFNFISPNSPHHSVIPPVSLVKDDNNGSMFYFFDPFQTQQFLTSPSQTQSLPTGSPFSENVVVHNEGEGLLAEVAQMEEPHTFNLKSKREAACSNAASNNRVVKLSSDLPPQIGMTSEDDLFDQEMVTSLLEFPVPPTFSEWYTTPSSAT